MTKEEILTEALDRTEYITKAIKAELTKEKIKKEVANRTWRWMVEPYDETKTEMEDVRDFAESVVDLVFKMASEFNEDD